MNQPVPRRELVRVMTRELLDNPADRAAWVRRLSACLLEHGMVDQLDMIVNDIAHELFLQAGVLTVEVTTARPLDDAAKGRLMEMLKTETGATDVAIHETVDESLVGGFTARTPDAEIDASVRSKLRALASLA